MSCCEVSVRRDRGWCCREMDGQLFLNYRKPQVPKVGGARPSQGYVKWRKRRRIVPVTMPGLR